MEILILFRYIANVTDLAALVLLDTCAERSAHFVRDFLEKHVTQQALFQLSLVSRAPHWEYQPH